MMFKGTVKEFAEKTGVSYQEAQGFITFLSAKDIAKKVGDVKPAGGKGKPSTIWEFPLSFDLTNHNV